MEFQENQSDYEEVVITLNNMFGDVMSKEAIQSVVENCSGDLNLSADVIANMSYECHTPTTYQEKDCPEINADNASAAINEQQSDIFSNRQTVENLIDLGPNVGSPVSETQATVQPVLSYADAFVKNGAVPKNIQKVSKSLIVNTWDSQIRRILSHHTQGSRILILMRGAPGSGKTYLAKQIVEMTIGASFIDYKTHICSTDDYFMVRGVYLHDKYKLHEAHTWNKNRVISAIIQGLSPIIVDNTNIELWEMEPYVKAGVQNGYIIEVVEPKTPWARKLNQLIKRNNHNVPYQTIKKMLDNYQDGINGTNLLKHLGLSYPADKVPPTNRSIPAVQSVIMKISNEKSSIINFSQNEQIQNDIERNPSNDPINSMEITSNESPVPNHIEKIYEETSKEVNKRIVFGPLEISESLIKDERQEQLEEEATALNRFKDIQKQLEEMEKLEREWENGENWDNETQTVVSTDNENAVCLEPKPPRKGDVPKLLDSVNKCEDWRNISMFMPTWNNEPSTSGIIKVEEIPVEKVSSGTCMEIGDTDTHNEKNTFKIISTTPRDINLFYMAFKQDKIPDKRMFDKSTMTNEQLIMEAYRCKNEEKHFIAFRKLFKNISKAALRDIFDKCCGDVNWAVDIVLNGMAENQVEIIDENKMSDNDDLEHGEQCDCVANYNIIPDVTLSSKVSNKFEYNIPSVSENSEIVPLQHRKLKKEKINSESSLDLKHQIEQNINISDSHYSEHCLKIRKLRRGEFTNESNSKQSSASASPAFDKVLVAETEKNLELSYECSATTSKQETTSISIESDDELVFDEPEKTVNFYLGSQFISQLDSIFGRNDMTYPQCVVPSINIPTSLLNEINALWMESLMYQLDEESKQSEVMLQQDEDFAKELAEKEAELAQAGKEPEVPDFKEIMDMDFAMSLYQKDIAEWRNNEPNDLAARMSREKLYNLFPEVSQDTLSELLMAHDNNFKMTVEVLLMSTGKAQILEQKNGVNKFVMEKELERQEKILNEEKKTLSEVEWPLLTKGDKVEMSTVDRYRDKANKHLASRNQSYQKAQDYISRGMTQVANYYSDLAVFHKQKYEQANSLAAASLMQIHSSNCRDNATIDLHYLRVGEAKEALDLFLDTHIQKLKEYQVKGGGPRYHTLFFITGRGLHSPGGPRVKPAVKKRLRERGLAYSERNPGLLTAKVCAEDILTFQTST